MQPDEIDWIIINRLREENVPNSVLARELDVSEGMIRHRLRRLKETGILQIKAQIDPDVLENQQLCVIAVNVSEAALLETKAMEIKSLKNVQAVSVVTGRYSLFVEVLVDSNHGLVRFLTEELSKIKGITNTESFVMLRTYGKFF